VINLTDAELDELQQEAWNHPVPVARALAELRQVREQKRYSDAGFASTLKRAVDRILALLDENERLRDALSSVLEHVEDTSITRGNEQCTLCFTYRDKIRAALASVKETTSV